MERVGLELVNNSDNTSTTYDFRVNPESMEDTHQSRTVVLPTRTTNTVQDFGASPIYHTISGTTGWGQGAGETKINELKDFLVSYQNDYSDNISTDYTLIYHNYTDGYSVNVKLSSDGFSISRSKDSPLAYTYSISMVEIGDAEEASTAEKTDTTLGNTSSSLETTTTSDSSYTNPTTSTSASSTAQSALGKALELN